MTPATSDTEPTGAYRLAQPTLDDARAAVHSLYGPHTDDIWQTLLFRAGLTGTETSPAALERLLGVMHTAEPIIRLCARGLDIRLSAYRSLTTKVQGRHPSR